MVTNHLDRVGPLSTVIPLPNGRYSWLLNWEFTKTTYEVGTHPPSTPGGSCSAGSPNGSSTKNQVRTLPPMMKRAGMMMHQLSERMGFFGFGSR